MHEYQESFYSGHEEESRRSAQKVVPLLLSWFEVRSVLDIGCGDGTWLAEFQRLGIADISGVDGPYVPRQMLKVQESNFLAHNLDHALSLGRTFDLVISLETAEHLPPEAAASFIDSLTKHGDLILFSAAVPYQGGENHVNEQWPDYWIRLFAQAGFQAHDILRPKIWNDQEISWWYRQNALIFVRSDSKSCYSCLGSNSQATTPLPLVHPAMLMNKLSEDRLDEYSLKLLAKTLVNRCRRKWKALFYPR